MRSFHLGLSIILGITTPLLAKKFTINSPECGNTQSMTPYEPNLRNYADRGQFPWAVHVTVFIDAVLQKECEGSIVTRRHVLTAAHCLKTNRRLHSIAVRYGSIDLRLTEVIFAIKYNFHPRYIPNTPNHDVGILLLEHPLEYSSQVRPVCLPETWFDVTGRKLFLPSWARQPRVTPDNYLQYWKLQVRANSHCKKIYGGKFRDRITLCASPKGPGLSTGYWGGPSTIRMIGGRHLQVGIASQFFDDLLVGSRVFARVDALMPWIIQNIENDSGYTRLQSGRPRPLDDVAVPSYLVSAGPLPAAPVAPVTPFVPTAPFAALYV